MTAVTAGPGIAAGGRSRALWATLFWLVVGIGSYVLGVRNAIGQRAENSVLDAAEFTTNPPPPLNLVSIPTVALALVAIGLLALWVHGVKRALVVTTVPAIAVLASQLLKLQLLTRPQLFELDAANTFPSGHMTVFTALVGALIWAVPAQIRALLALGGSALLGAVGWQLLAYGWHRPSDVFGGVALVCCVFAVAGLIRPAHARGHMVAGRTVSVGLALVGWIVAGAAVVLAMVAGLQSNADLMLSAGEFGAVAAGAIAARSLLRLSAGQE
ncbi:phosphatase PAP2 family protein [Leucobacter chromiireducens]|uniref:phosphatase PAP2 family protein n=1 Tax=Leucobacter chromiireducens TaxID=283877 RepID=UPI001F1553C7|nr:phosphatase PAP2 family protein [Leucobacter chromiireducens]